MLGPASVKGQEQGIAASDVEWERIQGFGELSRANLTLNASGDVVSTQAAKVLHLADATTLRSFSEKYPSHARAAEARLREGLSLQFAALYGDSSNEARRTSLVEELRADARLDSYKRFELVGWSYQVAIRRKNLSTKSDRLREQELATRALISEFPKITVGYESLLAIAEGRPVEQARTTAIEIITKTSDENVKRRASALIERVSLVGRGLGEVAQSVGAEELVRAGLGKITILYSWSKATPRYIEWATRVAGQNPGVHLLGVCVDADPRQARALISDIQVQNAYVFGDMVGAKALIEKLVFTKPGLIYIVDRAGAIRDIHGGSGTAQKLSQWK